MLYKRCSRCNKRIPMGSKCNCYSYNLYERLSQKLSQRLSQKKYDMEKRNKNSAEFYNSADWKNLREEAKKFCFGIDIYSYYKNNKLEYGTMVHHIKPIKEYPEDRLNLDNLIVLTEKNHQNIHKRMDNGEKEDVIRELNVLRERFIREFKR